MPGVTKEQIQAAREADLFAWLQSHEPGVLKRDGPNYRHKEHDSLVYVTGKRYQPPESYLRNAELYEEGQTGNYNMLDGRLNNEPPVKPDLTDGQTHEEIRELAPETLPEEKPSVLDRLKSERPEHEARQITPPVPERGL